MELTQRRVWIQIIKQIRMDRLCKKLKPCQVEDMAGEVMIQRVHPAIFHRVQFAPARSLRIGLQILFGDFSIGGISQSYVDIRISKLVSSKNDDIRVTGKHLFGHNRGGCAFHKVASDIVSAALFHQRPHICFP